MSNVWFCIPSARPNGGTAQRWRDAGYKVALCRDQDDECRELFGGDDGLVIIQPYEGYARSVNRLCREVLMLDPECDWCVTGGDDTLPDRRSPDDIAHECTEHFGGTFGVMQPTGDRWGERPELGSAHPFSSAYIDRVCGSPWMGREWCLRANHGVGPLYPAFWHMFVDQFLQESAKRQGVLWQRRDLVHMHHHWMRTLYSSCPGFLENVSTQAHWSEAESLYNQLAARDFVDGDAIPASVSVDCVSVP